MQREPSQAKSPASSKRHGFTIVEILIIAPIVILIIGAFIAVIVNMTGEVLTTRSANLLAYNIQDALNRIEQDVKSSGSYLATNNVTLASPQGYNNDTTAFKNVGNNGNMLILNTYATTANPLSADQKIIYAADQPNPCSSEQIDQNPPVMLNVVYFVKDNTLWRRVLAPTAYATMGCSVPWQQPSCAPSIAGALCKAMDVRLVDGVLDSGGFSVDYFTNPSAASPNSIATNSSKSDVERLAALQSTNTIKVTINATQSVAGREFSQSGTIRTTSLNNNIAATANEKVPVITTNPQDKTVLSNATNVTFTAAASGTSPTVQWQRSTDKGATWSNIAGATSSTLTLPTVSDTWDGYRYRASFTNNQGQVFSSNALLNITSLAWNDISFRSGWSNYHISYSPASYRRTSAGVVALKGLIKKSSAVTASEVIGTLPPSYRPSHVLIFPTSTNANVYAQIQVYPNGDIMVVKGDAGWLSLEGINFIPDNGRYTPTLANPILNGWKDYSATHGGNYAPASYTADDTGRVYLQGLVTGGTVADNIKIYGLPSNLLPSLYMHLPAANNTYAIFGIEPVAGAAQGVTAKAYGSNGYVSLQALYYPASYSSWSNMGLTSGWVTYDGARFTTPQYTKSSDGLVTLKGLIRSGSSGGAVITTLPVGYRPAERVLYGSPAAGAYSRIDILPNGQVLHMQGSNAWTSLDNISFYADQ